MHPVPWTPALRNTARRLNAKQMDWWLTGSMALAVRGVPIEPRDIDLVVAEPDVTRAAEAFADVLIEPSVEAKDGSAAGLAAHGWARASSGLQELPKKLTNRPVCTAP